VKIDKIDSWDENFFNRFADFKNKIHKDIPTSFPETSADYANFMDSVRRS
jgi:hypothetical protein